MLNLEMFFFNIILKLSLKKSIRYQSISFFYNDNIIVLLNKTCLSCIHDKPEFYNKYFLYQALNTT